MVDQFEAVIAAVGYKAAGKDTFCKYLIAHHGFNMVSTGDIIREIAKAEGIAQATTADLQDIGDRERRASGDNGYWMHRLIAAARERGWRRVVLNGIRNPVEVETLKGILGARLTLSGVVAPTMVRAERFIKRFPEVSTLEQFLVIDDRDRGIGQPPEGQQVDRTLAFVPFANVYNNIGTPSELEAWADALLMRILLPSRV